MSKTHLHPYAILSVQGPLYIPLNFSLPRFVFPGDGVCFLTSQECTLLQKLLRYRSEGPVMLKDQHLSEADLVHIPFLLDRGPEEEQCPVSLTAAVPVEMTWDQKPPAVRSVQRLSAVFFSQDTCEQTQRDILAAREYLRFSRIFLSIRQEKRKPKDTAALCCCELTSVYKDIAFYALRESCPRHERHPEAEITGPPLGGGKNEPSCLRNRTGLLSSLLITGAVTPPTSLNPSTVF